MEEKKKKLRITANKKIVTFSLIALALLMIVSTSYAYFTATITGNDTAKQTKVTTGTMALKLHGNTQVGMSSAMPGESTTITFSVENTGTLATTYALNLDQVTNNFADKNDLVYTITSTNGGGSKTETVIPSANGILIPLISIEPKVTQEYTMTITFKETNDIQNDNQGKTFTGRVQIVDADESKLLTKKILDDNTIQKNELVFGKDSTDKGLYEISGDKTIDGNPTYYFRGNVDNNYVQFGTYKDNYTIGITPDKGHVSTFATLAEAQLACNNNYSTYDYENATACINDIKNNLDNANTPILWNIVRINEDGTVRLILDRGINSGTYYLYNYDEEMAVISSTDTYNVTQVKEELEQWYNIHLSDSTLISNGRFCENLSVTEETYDNNEISFNCPSNYIFNAYAGLVTVDEAVYAGVGWWSKNISYMYSDKDNSTKASWILPIIVDVPQQLTTYRESDIYGDSFNISAIIRPVINLKSDAIVISGDGTKDNPYVIE